MLDFDVRDGRVMVSLGRLTQGKYCTYSCPFCYVQSNNYGSYHSLDVSQIVEWIRNVKEPYDIIYVSGDTDSFAPPRAETGIELLEALCEFDVDILFTTRALFSENHIERLKNIRSKLDKKNRLLFGCVSISQLHNPDVEPHPIPTPYKRLEQLQRFKEIGIVSVLAMRPFLPVIPDSEYIEIVNLSKSKVDIILGSAWYFDTEQIIEKRLLHDEIIEFKFSYTKIDFHESNAVWKVYYGQETELIISRICGELTIPFFMRSSPAINFARNKKLKKFKSVVFDLDNTIYPSSNGISGLIDNNVVEYIQNKLRMDRVSAEELSKKYQEKYGLAVCGLIKDFKIDIDDFFEVTHNIDYQSQVKLNPELPLLLNKIPIQKTIFSNAPKKHVDSVLERLNIKDCFDLVLDLNYLDINPKPSAQSYSRLLDAVGYSPENIIIIDDNPNNLIPAKLMGMTTILVTEFSINSDNKADFSVSNIVEAINLVMCLVN